jgi:hypothetical protein
VKVLDHEPHAWFLLEDEGAFYLDAHCSLSVLDYSVLIALDADETSTYRAQGRPYLDALAERIHNSAPAAAGSTSPYRSRNLAVGQSAENAKASAAIAAWRCKPSP